MLQKKLEQAATMIKRSTRTMAITGAGISVESGVPPFRGENGLYNRYKPETFEINYFLEHSKECWEVMRDIFHQSFGKVEPNAAHYALAELEKQGLLHSVITQNVDTLHTDAGSKNVYEFHGAMRELVCMGCGKKVRVEEISLDILPPLCKKCNSLLKPNVIYFGESPPGDVSEGAFKEAELSDLLIIIGSTGIIAPANMLPSQAKQRGAIIIEINISPSAYTDTVTDIFLQGKATEMMEALMEAVNNG